MSKDKAAVIALMVGALVGGFVGRAMAPNPITPTPQVSNEAAGNRVSIKIVGRYPCNEDEWLQGRGDYAYPGVWTRYVCKVPKGI